MAIQFVREVGRYLTPPGGMVAQMAIPVTASIPAGRLLIVNARFLTLVGLPVAVDTQGNTYQRDGAGAAPIFCNVVHPLSPGDIIYVDADVYATQNSCLVWEFSGFAVGALDRTKYTTVYSQAGVWNTGPTLPRSAADELVVGKVLWEANQPGTEDAAITVDPGPGWATPVTLAFAPIVTEQGGIINGAGQLLTYWIATAPGTEGMSGVQSGVPGNALFSADVYTYSGTLTAPPEPDPGGGIGVSGHGGECAATGGSSEG